MLKIITFISLLFFFATCCPANSQPSISSFSGDFIHGGLITISGNNFGVKSTAPPLLFDDFSHGSDGTIIRGRNASHYGAWDDEKWDADAIYSTENQRSGSAMSSKHPLRVNTDENHAPLRFKHPGGFTKVYMSFWIRWSWGNVVDVYGNYQIKWWQFGGLDVGGATSGPLLNNVMFKTANYGTHDLFADNAAAINACDSAYPKLFGEGDWVRLEFQAKLINDQTGSAKSIVFYSPGTEPGTILMKCTGKTIADNELEVYDVIYFSEYLTNSGDPDGNHGADLYYDNIYIDNTWARVEICDAPVWENCTSRETQIAESWSNQAITTRLNVNTLSNFNELYLYVIDENGIVNNSGYPINEVVIMPTTPSDFQKSSN